MITRRQLFGAAAVAAAAPCPGAGAGRKLDLQIGPDFGNAREADIRAVLLSAGNALWQHCPNTRWDVPGFDIFHRTDCPICLDDHRADGRIAIGLTTQGTYWAQFAYQFSHEFCHALTGHSNDWRKLWRTTHKANQWFEEALCETASLFALRTMGKSWQTAPPYPNWKDFSAALTNYARERLDATAKAFPRGSDFGAWFRDNEAALRKHATQREKNNIIAAQLLPLFEAQPTGWEVVTFLNLGQREPEATLAAHFANWLGGAPAAQHAFIKQLASLFKVTP